MGKKYKIGFNKYPIFEDENYNYYSYCIFKGEYFNGQKNGKGIEYYDTKITFEGEYLNGKRKK